MKKFALTAAALFSAAVLTFAGSPERYKSQQQTEIPPSCAQFGGFDVGVNIGGAFETNTWNDRDAWVDNFGSDWAVGGQTKDRTGITTGASVGYNWQKGCALFGLQVDGSWSSIDGSRELSPTSDPTGTKLTIDDQLDWWGTARTRTGVVVDNLLLYITGGFAFANIDHDWRIRDIGSTPPSESFSADSFRWGGVAGFGGEWALNSRWSLRSEFLFVYFTEEKTDGFSEAGDQNVHFDSQDKMLVSRIALVYRFGGGR
jgi:outer membrane immunogenic protein